MVEEQKIDRAEFEKRQQQKMKEFTEMSEAEKRHFSEGTPQNEQQIKQAQWNERTMQPLRTVTEEDLTRRQEELKQKRLLREKEQIETSQAREALDKEFWDAIVTSCSDPETRDANYIIRAGKMNLFVETIMMPVAEKVRRINQLRRLHHQTGVKEKLNLADYMAAADLFVSDPIVHRGDVILKRKQMFPSEPSDSG